MHNQDHTDDDLIEAADALHARASAAQRELFGLILEIDLTGAWGNSGARDLAHWLVMRYGISYWKALRWIQAAHALVELPLISEAFASGALGIDQVVELTRFATPETEERLVRWAQGVSCGAIGTEGTWPIGPSRRPKRRSRPGPCAGGTSPSHPGSACPRSSPRRKGRWWPRPWNIWPIGSR